jgi:hypothetical protein
MNILLGILLIVWGLGLMAFGLWLFYTLLPFWYGLFGAVVGFYIGAWITGSSTGWFASLVVWLFAIGGAVVFAGLSYGIEPIRRVLAGILIGFAFGALLAALFGGGTVLTIILGVIGAVIFAVLVPLFFDPLVVVGSAVSGAALVMDGLFLIIPSLGFLVDRANAANDGNFWAIVVWIVLAALGILWQWSNISRWVQAESYAPVRAA